MAKTKSVGASNTYETLVRSYVPSLPLSERKILTASEEGRKYTLDISGGKRSVMFDVDGNIIKDGLKCDKLVLIDASAAGSKNVWIEIFVELKGTDVAHAIDQLRATMKNRLFSHQSNKMIKARIEAASFPANKSNPVMEKAKKEFASLPYRCELRGLKNGQRDKV